MSDAPVAVADTPVEAVALPTPISVEPRVASPVETAEIARQAEEAKLPKDATKEVKADKDEPKKPLSTREVLRAAREKVEAESATPLKTDSKAAEPTAKVDAPKADAKLPEAKTAEPAKADAPKVDRAPDGKFVSTDPAKVAEAAATKVEPVKEAPKPSHTAEPPPSRYSAKAKEEWATLPDESRAEALRLEKEYKAGFEKYKSAAERDTAHAKWHDMAAKGNTTLEAALTAYTNMESLLRKDPDKGLEALFQNIGISPREWATKLLGQTPDVAAGKTDATIIELRNEIAELKRGLGGIEQERTQTRTATTTEAVTKFAADHLRFDELAEDIAFFLKTKHPGDLAKAYEAAERLNPAPVQKEALAPAASSAPSATITPLVQPAPASAAAARSIAGAPTAGSDPARKQPSRNIKEALRRAAAAVA